MKRLAIVTSHPIQYYAPVFQLLAKSDIINIKVFYTWGENSVKKHDPGFNKTIEWDIPFLEGYNYEFLSNTAKDQGTHHFNGIVNPTAIQKIKQYNPDVVLVYGWSLSSHFKIIRYFSGKIPVWFRGDSTLLNASTGVQFNVKLIIKFILLRWIYKYVTKAFYVGSNNKSYFQYYGLKEEQLVFSPHAIDNHRFSQDRSVDALEFRKNLGIPTEDIIILFAGKLENIKNPLLLLDIWNNFPEKTNKHMLIVGNGILEETLKKNALRNVHFMDFQNQSQMPVAYQACDLFCLPSLSETWGLAVNEAMSCGKAILVSDRVGCALDLVREGYNGAIFMSNSKDDFKNKFKFLMMKEKEELKRMGQISLDIIKDWTFENQVKAIKNEILKLK